MKFEFDYIEKLVNLLSESNLTEITLEDVDKAIVLRKEKEIITTQTYAQPAASAPVLASTVTSQVADTKTEITAPAPENKGKPIVSPMVGTFYKSPSPDSKPFISVGEGVAVGQVVCIIEAMKLMNEIESEVSGKVTEICVEDGQTVEYGQVLMYVE